VSSVVLKNTALNEQRCSTERLSSVFFLKQRCSLSSAFFKTTLLTHFGVLENNTAHSDQYSLEQRCSQRTLNWVSSVVLKNTALNEQRCSTER
jgi:hypothetical protein